MNQPIIIATFYKFVPLPDYRELRQRVMQVCTEHAVKGTILLAGEGINATIAGTREAVHPVLSFLREDERLSDLSWRESYAEAQPFKRMKVRAKKEIVTLGVPGIDPSKQVGAYVPPEDWNALISADDVVVVDTRNDFEVQLGTFQGAVNPGTTSFRQFPDFVAQQLDPEKHARIAMFCTGGIRCEKATAFMLTQGFKEVYHLEGGILKYLEVVPQEKSTWKGACFVFDEREVLDHDLKPAK